MKINIFLMHTVAFSTDECMVAAVHLHSTVCFPPD